MGITTDSRAAACRGGKNRNHHHHLRSQGDAGASTSDGRVSVLLDGAKDEVKEWQSARQMLARETNN